MLANRRMVDTTVREPRIEDAEQLAGMLCDDDGLRSDLGLESGDRPTAEQFQDKVRTWCGENRATTFAIVTGDTAVGTISLSHRSEDGNTAGIGYWVGTWYRRQGHCKRAFEAVLRQAALEGISSVRGTVDAKNIASRRIWERQGAASTTASGSRIRYELSIIGQ